MIKYQTIREIKNNKEGEILIAALAILTTISKKDIDENKWGGMVNPDKALQQVVELANKIYYEKEWEIEQKIEERAKKINNVINGTT